MRKSISVLAWLCGAAAMLVAGAAFAEGNASAGEAIFKNGKADKGVMACFTCHGDKAQGNDDMGAPRLAGQGMPYIVKQLKDFAGDKRTPAGAGAVMPTFAKGLSDEDMQNVAAYVNSITGAEFSDLKKLGAGGQKVGEPYLGQVLVKFGVKDKVSACQSCHGYNGRGAAPVFPMIGQQKYVYLVNQLKNWRASADDVKAGVVARTNDPAAMMRAVAKNLTDDDINNAAAFLASAPETTQGNHRVPTQD